MKEIKLLLLGLVSVFSSFCYGQSEDTILCFSPISPIDISVSGKQSMHTPDSVLIFEMAASDIKDGIKLSPPKGYVIKGLLLSVEKPGDSELWDMVVREDSIIPKQYGFFRSPLPHNTVIYIDCITAEKGGKLFRTKRIIIYVKSK